MLPRPCFRLPVPKQDTSISLRWLWAPTGARPLFLSLSGIFVLEHSKMHMRGRSDGGALCVSSRRFLLLHCALNSVPGYAVCVVCVCVVAVWVVRCVHRECVCVCDMSGWCVYVR